MLNCVYRLIAPRVFEPVIVDVAEGDTLNVVVRPTHLSICNADIRYYQGNRNPEILKEKLPMALIHEGIGVVVADPTSTFERGSRVVIVPNQPHEENPFVAENYLRTSDFCGSGQDGFMQEYLFVSPARLVALPDDIDGNVAAFTELVSVAIHAVNRFDVIAHAGRDAVGVWGDGNLGFIVSLVLKMKYPEMRVVVFGRNAHKLNDFTFVDEICFTYDVASDMTIDHAFECCGGDGLMAAVDQIINLIRPEGTVSLLGVSENSVAINTRMILEKGLRFFGSSRSGKDDFEQAVQMYKEHPESLNYLAGLVASSVGVSNMADLSKVFEDDIKKPMGKMVMKWNM